MRVDEYKDLQATLVGLTCENLIPLNDFLP